MISSRKQRKYVLVATLVNGIGSFQIQNPNNKDIIHADLSLSKNAKERKQRIRSIKNLAEGLNYPCYKPITVQITVGDQVYCGSVCMRDDSTNLDEIEETAKERGLV